MKPTPGTTSSAHRPSTRGATAPDAAAGVPLTGPRRLDQHQSMRVSEVTRQRYRLAVKPFIEWLLAYGLLPATAEEYDDLLVEFKNSEECALSRSQFTRLVSSIEWAFPHFKGRLSWCHASLAGWQCGEPTRHTVPLSRHQAVLVAVHLCSRGLPRLALALLLQCELGLRSCELLALQKEDISLPARLGGPQHQHYFILGLGAKSGTKVKRAQYVVLRQESEPVFSLLVRLTLATRTGALFPYSHAFVRQVAQYHRAGHRLPGGLDAAQRESRLRDGQGYRGVELCSDQGSGPLGVGQQPSVLHRARHSG